MISTLRGLFQAELIVKAVVEPQEYGCGSKGAVVYESWWLVDEFNITVK